MGITFVKRSFPSFRLNFIAREVQSHLSDSIGLANFMKKFNYDDSCVYTRSVLQVNRNCCHANIFSDCWYSNFERVHLALVHFLCFVDFVIAIFL